MMQNVFKNIWIYFQEYCNHTSVHGLSYFGEKKRHILERVWWFIICVISLTACLNAIYAIYRKWDESPVIVNFGNKATPIFEIPFPAFTICPESKSAQDKFNFTEVLQKNEDGVPLNTTEEDYFEYMSLICNYYEDIQHIYKNNLTFTEEFFDVMDYVKPSFQISNCTFVTGPLEDCEEYFTPVITDEGVCYSFNILDRTKIYRESVLKVGRYHDNSDFSPEEETWSLQNGYLKDAGMFAYPLRAYLAGAKNGFSFNILTPKKNLDYACKDSLQGYRIQLHSPLTIPRPSMKYFRVPLDQSVVGAVTPVVITTSKRIQAYNPEQRRCYFSSERYLKYFKNYTSSNCNLECLTNYTLIMCNCVNYFMPRENGTKICGTGARDCMKKAEEIMYQAYISKKLDDELFEVDEAPDCNCLPICADLTYEYDTSQTNFNWKKLLEARRSLPQIDNNSHLSSLTLFFQSDNFIPSERNELYGPLDFISNVGGILGLFIGFSMLSLVEIIYFLSIRILCNLRLFGQWTGKEKQ